jgi:putative Holliday junction resolvase
MRVLGVDFGQRRIGLALSDASGTLARPWKTIAAGPTPRDSADLLVQLVRAGFEDAESELGGLHAIVIGIPRRLNGDDTQQTAPARAFKAAVSTLLPHLHVDEQDERLTSLEADRLLAERERDWRRRKEKLDAAAAAIILQDYLDRRVPAPSDSGSVDDHG